MCVSQKSGIGAAKRQFLWLRRGTATKILGEGEVLIHHFIKERYCTTTAEQPLFFFFAFFFKLWSTSDKLSGRDNINSPYQR